MQAGRMYSQDIRMRFGIEKYTILIMKRGKLRMKNRMELPNSEKI